MVLALLSGLFLIMILPLAPYWLVLGAGLLSTHLNGSGSQFASAASVGWVNSAAIVLVPAILVLRLGRLPRPTALRSPAVIISLAGLVWVATAGSWSPFPLSAAKQVFFFLHLFVLVAVLIHGLSEDQRSVRRALWVFLLGGGALGLLQTFVADGSFGQIEGRFTSFTGPQGFAIAIVAVVPILLAMAQRKGRPLSVVLALLVPAVIMPTGSRSAFLLSLGVAAVAVVGSLLDLAFRRRLNSPVLVVCTGFAFSVLAVAIGGVFTVVDVTELMRGRGRIGEAFEAVGANAGVASLNTAAWRVGMYAATVDELVGSDSRDLLLGHGTSSAASIVVTGPYRYRDYDEYTVDANRIVHNEALRTAFEWGLVGLLFALLGAGFILRRLLRIAAAGDPWVTLLTGAAVVTLVAFSMVENLFASAGRPSGVAVACVLAAVAAWGTPNRSQVSACASS